jgi:D-alanine-D-alanine ligase
MRVAVVHQAISEESTVEEADVLAQCEAIVASLKRLGHDTCVLPCTLDLSRLRQELGRFDPHVIYNLVESLAGSDQLITVAPTLYEALGYAYTGVSAQGIWLTTNKLRAKQFYRSHNIPTLPWLEATHGSDHVERHPQYDLHWPCRWIRKPVWEHASFGMSDAAVIPCENITQVANAVCEWEELLHRPCFAEPYVAGREFNLSLLGGRNGVEVLPPAEIEFLDFSSDKPHIVGFAAKWTENAAEYAGTPRRFDFTQADAPLLQKLREIALQCWNALGLTGYARVDFRVDCHNQPWVLEVNANPCFAPWSGFTAAVEQAGYTYDQAMQRILDQACQLSGKQPLNSTTPTVWR